jgi:succinate dehydrogenase / fumarate reductase cytochrome b subunit
MNNQGHPLSPHLQIYRLPLSAVLSIAHRIAGAALALGVLFLVYVLWAAALGPQAYEGARGLIGSWPGQVLLFAFTYALFFHLCNGIRHLFWDAGLGFDPQVAQRSAWTVLVVSVLLSAAVWGLALIPGGGAAP